MLCQTLGFRSEAGKSYKGIVANLTLTLTPGHSLQTCWMLGGQRNMLDSLHFLTLCFSEKKSLFKPEL